MVGIFDFMQQQNCNGLRALADENSNFLPCYSGLAPSETDWCFAT